MVTALALQLIAIAHATVIDPAAGSIRPDNTVLVRGTRIEAAGASRSVRIPAGTRVIDATGKYLIPGLWDMVLRRGATLFTLGALTGLVLAWATVRVLSTLVYAVAPHDVISFVLATLVLFIVSMRRRRRERRAGRAAAWWRSGRAHGAVP